MDTGFIRNKKNIILKTAAALSCSAAIICSSASCGKTATDSTADNKPVVTSATTTYTEASSSVAEKTSTTVSSSSKTTASSASTTSTSSKTSSSSAASTSTTAKVTTTVSAKLPVQSQTSTKPATTTSTKATTTATASQKPPVSATTTTAAAPPPVQNGESPNSSFYQQNVVIAGDSVALGFSVYGFIPSYHSISLGSLSMSNMDWFYPQNKGVGYVDAAVNSGAKLLYMSMGMNDVNVTTPEKYAAKYVSVIQQILQRSPNTTIVAAGITPVSYSSTFTTNAKIRSFNSALQNAVNSMGSSHVIYFDAYSVVADPGSLALMNGYSSGDGIHLAPKCYGMILKALYNKLDTTAALQNMHG